MAKITTIEDFQIGDNVAERVFGTGYLLHFHYHLIITIIRWVLRHIEGFGTDKRSSCSRCRCFGRLHSQRLDEQYRFKLMIMIMVVMMVMTLFS